MIKTDESREGRTLVVVARNIRHKNSEESSADSMHGTVKFEFGSEKTETLMTSRI
jgi:hypothetical protein